MTSKKILIVDDDPDLVFGLTVRLKANGYCVISAVDATSGLKMNHDEHPDLVILDLGLPDQDGLAVLGQIKAVGNGATPPTIVLSGRNALSNKELAIKAGAFGFLQKPPENEVLLGTIKRALSVEARVTGLALTP